MRHHSFSRSSRHRPNSARNTSAPHMPSPRIYARSHSYVSFDGRTGFISLLTLAHGIAKTIKLVTLDSTAGLSATLIAYFCDAASTLVYHNSLSLHLLTCQFWTASTHAFGNSIAASATWERLQTPKTNASARTSVRQHRSEDWTCVNESLRYLDFRSDALDGTLQD